MSKTIEEEEEEEIIEMIYMYAVSIYLRMITSTKVCRAPYYAGKEHLSPLCERRDSAIEPGRCDELDSRADEK